ncbi:MAG: hypothetical protein LPJ89_03150 [Hymenobacteraceae bacterium]|nr:hypothetical protein [Hymenobacteraceae bacterium]
MKLNKLIYTLLFLLFLFVGLQAQAQRPDVQEWPYGRVILTDGDTLAGTVVYHRNEDIVRVQNPDGSTSAFSPANVFGFDVAASKSGKMMQYFRTYRWNKGNDYSDFTVPTFFEQLNEGKYSLLRRETTVRRDMSRDPMYRNDPYYNRGFGRNAPFYVDEKKNLFYLLTPEQKVITLRNVKKDLQRVFGEKAKEMKAFVKQNKLSYNKPQDLVTIVNYYNSLQK